MSEGKGGNQLGSASSAYLRSAAHQPVWWQEWGEPAFRMAKEQDKPILLDIGAVWCHWCHVMDRESYESDAIAGVINEHYIPIKVDRDERPDIDARYQAAVGALTGQGGWPLTAFLTPDGKPFYGGTYFPPDDRYGRPGMRRALEEIARNYKTQKSKILQSAEKISAALAGAERFEPDGGKATASLVGSILESIGRAFDMDYGGFSHSPKFPHTSALDLLLDAYLETGRPSLLTEVTATLEGMGRGGVYDQIGGGFHRYSVDERWIVPHFEKMSYDNAGLLVNYLGAYRVAGNELFREIARGTLSFIESVLAAPGGGFYASQDADYGLDDDGDYFTWTLDEVVSALDDLEAEVVRQHYHVEPAGQMHHNPAKNVLYVDQPLEAIAARLRLKVDEVERILATAKAKMLAARAKRPTPQVDTALYSAWNGMMISAFLEGYRVLGFENLRDRALETLNLFLTRGYDPVTGMVHRLLVPGASLASGNGSRAPDSGMLDDQVFMTQALLDASEVTGTRVYFDRALELMDTTIRRFWDNEAGGFFDTAKDLEGRQGALSVRRKAFQDAPTPAANAVAVMALDRLAGLAGRADFTAKAEATLDLFASKAPDYGPFAATYGLALANHVRPPVQIVVVGPPADDRTRELLESAYAVRRAGRRVLAFDPFEVKAGNLPPGLESTLPHLPARFLDEGTPVALVCVGSACLGPAETSEALQTIASAGRPAS